MTSGTQLIFCILEVNGAATLASASDNEIPTWANKIQIYLFRKLKLNFKEYIYFFIFRDYKWIIDGLLAYFI